MKKYFTAAIFTGVLAPFSGWAINVGDITSIMTSTESSLSKEITNTTDSARFVSVSVKQLSSPLADGVEIKPANNGELLSTPANLILPGQATDVFRFSIKVRRTTPNAIIVCNGLTSRSVKMLKPKPIKWR